MRYFILVLFAALAVAVPVASANAVKATPKASITKAVVSGKSVKFDLLVKAASNVPGCKGTVTASHKLSKKKTVAWTGKLKATGVDCAATIKGKLPKAKFGKKVKFTFKFPGNKSLKKFNTSKSLKLSPPPAPLPPAPTPGTGAPGLVGPQHPGSWFMFKKEDNTDSGWTFTIGQDYKVPSLIRPSSLTMSCAVGGNTQLPFIWNSAPFGMGLPVGTVQSGGNGPHLRNMVHTLNWNFTGPNAGTGHFSSVGEFRYALPDDWTACSTSFDVTFSGGNP
jgi:hypothetical protein